MFFNATRTLHDLVDYCKFRNINGVLLMIDFEKAFDSLEWSFIFKTLEHMNFSQSFIRWIRLFYNNIESCVINNGVSSKYFRLNRGVRQGDPLSSYLFILCLEAISSNIINDNAIKGITVNDTEIKLIQYADDTTAVLKDQRSVFNFMNKIKSFADITGLKVNDSKTDAIFLGNTPNFSLPSKIKWSDKPVKVLGIYISWQIEEAYKITLEKKINQTKQLLYSWQHRKLTLNGRVLIIKSLAISQLTHILGCIPI